MSLIEFARKHLYRSLFFDRVVVDLEPYLKETSAKVFSCIYFKRSSYVNWLIFCCCFWLIFSCCCCSCWCCHIKFQIKSSLTPLGRRKAVSRWRLPFFRISFTFYLSFIGWYFFSRESAKKVENCQPFFSLIFFNAVFQMSQLRMLSLKSSGFTAQAEIVTEWKTSKTFYCFLELLYIAFALNTTT